MYNVPYINMNGFYSERELVDQSYRVQEAFDIGIMGFETYSRDVDRQLDVYDKWANKMANSLPAIRSDILNQKSVVQEQTRLNLDRSLKNQSSRIATMAGGPAGLMMAQMNKEANKQELNTMAQSNIDILKEDQERKKLYYDVSDQRIGRYLETTKAMDDLINKSGAANTSMAQAGMQGLINTTKNLVSLRMTASSHEIERDRMQMDWNKTVLGAEVSVYDSQLDFMASRFSSISQYEAHKYDSYIKARANVYMAQTEHGSSLLHSMMAAESGYQQKLLEANTYHDISLRNLGHAYYNTDLNYGMDRARLETAQYGAMAGYDETTRNSILQQINTAASNQHAASRRYATQMIQQGTEAWTAYQEELKRLEAENK